MSRDEPDLVRLLEQRRNRRDVGGEVIDELGFSIGLWNRARPAVGMSGMVGAYPNVSGLLNCFVLNSAAPGDGAEKLYFPEVSIAIFRAIVDAWEPEWATWTTHGLRDIQGAGPREPVVGWLTYLRGNGALELSGRVAVVTGEGVILEAAPDFAAVDEDAVMAVRHGLDRLGLIRPIP